jgi:hypothetical protein
MKISNFALPDHCYFAVVSVSSLSPVHCHPVVYLKNLKYSPTPTTNSFFSLKITFMEFHCRFRCRLQCSQCCPSTQSMAIIPSFTGDCGPILSLTGQQRMEYSEYTLFLRVGCTCSLTWSALPSMICQLKFYEGMWMSGHGDLVSTLVTQRELELINMPCCH